jgi:hypothetical protein
VPYLLFDSQDHGAEAGGPGGEYTERGVADAPVVPAHTLMARLLA